MLYQNSVLLLLAACGVLATTEGSNVERGLRNRQLASKKSKGPKSSKGQKEGKIGKSCKTAKAENVPNPFNPLAEIDSLVSVSIEIGSEEYAQFDDCPEGLFENPQTFEDSIALIESLVEIDLSDGTGTAKACVDDDESLIGRFYLSGYDLIIGKVVTNFFTLPPGGSLIEDATAVGWYEFDEGCTTITFNFIPSTIDPIEIGPDAFGDIPGCSGIAGWPFDLEVFLDAVYALNQIPFDGGTLQVCTGNGESLFGRISLDDYLYDLTFFGTIVEIVPPGSPIFVGLASGSFTITSDYEIEFQLLPPFQII